jgi:hypothetical protein
VKEDIMIHRFIVALALTLVVPACGGDKKASTGDKGQDTSAAVRAGGQVATPPAALEKPSTGTQPERGAAPEKKVAAAPAQKKKKRSSSGSGCQSGYTMCATGCQNLKNDRTNCGACGHECTGEHFACGDGQCW